MQLRQIVVPTLARLPKRRELHVKYLLESHVPHSIIKYIHAYDYYHYQHDRDGTRAVNDAYASGWEINPQKAVSYRGWHGSHLKQFCVRWTFTIIFKHLINRPTNDIYMFLLDDFILLKPYEHLMQILDDAASHAAQSHPADTPFILQITSWDRSKYPLTMRDPIPNNPYVCQGLAGYGDGALIVNPPGAAAIYNKMCETGGSLNLEGQLWEMSQQPPQPGHYSLVKNHTICSWAPDIHSIV